MFTLLLCLLLVVFALDWLMFVVLHFLLYSVNAIVVSVVLIDLAVSQL